MKVQLPKEVITGGNFIGGEWVTGEAITIDVRSPYNGAKIGEVSVPSASQIKLAMEKARAAQVEWGKTPMKERARVLFNFRNILMRELDEISHLKSAESGKAFEEGKAGLMKGIEVLEYALSLQNMDIGGRMEVSRGVSCEYRRIPLGVVASITPFNFPAMVPMWTIPIAIALGNAYVWKPSEKTPLTSLMLANALKEAGLPDGILTVLHGGGEVVNAIIDAPEVKAVGFVGSTKIAKLVYTRATAQGKRALCMGGAKNHIVLLPDANPELAGPGISDSFTGCAGQRCMAASVLLAVGDVDRHIHQIIKRAESLKLGANMGAIITRQQRDFLVSAIDRAEALGAKVILDGRRVEAPKGMEGGNWIGPTILDNVQPGSEASTIELFGPVLSIIRCKDITEAMRVQNMSEYGNACSVFTNSGTLAERVIQEAKAGMVGVNVGVPVPREPFSFGGIAASKFGSGDITGENSLNFWSDVKKVTTKWEKQNDNNWMS
jgi:malonate-semialdehyde dehydrogenase (acetylating)/methylmalonate-semialdehyde dehydrogenase